MNIYYRKKFEKIEDLHNKINIQSDFWIPDYRPDYLQLIEQAEPFLHNYIHLKKVNLKVLAENYIA